jgi:hypothetical protein
MRPEPLAVQFSRAQLLSRVLKVRVAGSKYERVPTRRKRVDLDILTVHEIGEKIFRP